eukprot:9280877-Pyramimonas_sp.AAC.2
MAQHDHTDTRQAPAARLSGWACAAAREAPGVFLDPSHCPACRAMRPATLRPRARVCMRMRGAGRAPGAVGVFWRGARTCRSSSCMRRAAAPCANALRRTESSSAAAPAAASTAAASCSSASWRKRGAGASTACARVPLSPIFFAPPPSSGRSMDPPKRSASTTDSVVSFDVPANMAFTAASTSAAQPGQQLRCQPLGLPPKGHVGDHLLKEHGARRLVAGSGGAEEEAEERPEQRGHVCAPRQFRQLAGEIGPLHDVCTRQLGECLEALGAGGHQQQLQGVAL